MSFVSVIIPTFNAETFITETIRSVLAQSHNDLEVIVVDDCSTDDTVKLVREISRTDSRLTLIELKKNFGGPAGPRNIGVSKAVGDWICFLDADDLWHTSKLSLQLAALEKTGAAFCCTQVTRFSSDRQFDFTGPLSEQEVYSRYTFRQICSRNRICNSSVSGGSSSFKVKSFQRIAGLSCGGGHAVLAANFGGGTRMYYYRFSARWLPRERESNLKKQN